MLNQIVIFATATATSEETAHMHNMWLLWCSYHFPDRKKLRDFSDKFAANKSNKCTEFVNTDCNFVFFQ